MLYQDINLNITLKEFQNINNDLKRYEFIMISYTIDIVTFNGDK